MSDLLIFGAGTFAVLAVFTFGAWVCDRSEAADARRRNHVRRMR